MVSLLQIINLDIMYARFFITLFFSMSFFAFAKEMIVKDLDGDGKFDKITINQETKTIDYLLSSSAYKKQTSLPFAELSKDASLEETKNGFKFENNIGTTVFTSFFRYNKKENNIELVALKRKIVSNDYSTENGESSFDTVSKEFVGKWNRLDQSTNKVIALPTLKAKIDLENVSLNNFNDNYLKKFEQQSLTFYKAEIAK